MRRIVGWLRGTAEYERWFVIVTFAYIVITMADNHEWWALGVFAGAFTITVAVNIYVAWRRKRAPGPPPPRPDGIPMPRDPTKPST